MDFQDIIMFFQNVPTKDWPEGEIQVLFSEAFMWLFCKINPCNVVILNRLLFLVRTVPYAKDKYYIHFFSIKFHTSDPKSRLL